jgi:hypothetical protein
VYVNVFKSDVPGTASSTTYIWGMQEENASFNWVTTNLNGTNWSTIITTDCGTSGAFATQRVDAGDTFEYWTKTGDLAPHPLNC